MSSEPIPGSPAKRRRRRRRKGGGGNAPAVNTPAQGSRRAPQEDDAGKSFPEPKVATIDFDRVAVECLEPRHLEIFEWMKKSLGKSSETLLKEFVRGAVVKERVAFREAQGIVSNSVRDIATLLNR